MPVNIKSLHVPFGFRPDPIGGTEVYVEHLVKSLTRCGAEAIIAAPGKEYSAYEHDGINIIRYAVSDKPSDLRELYGGGDALSALQFRRILDEQNPQIVHLHAFTKGVSLLMVREAKLRGVKVVFTYHTPTVSCQRGTLIRWGQDVCDGKFQLHKCTGCTLHGLGLSKATSLMLSRLPAAVGRVAGYAGLSGGGWTALRMTELVQLRHSALRALMEEVDGVVALCRWVKELLVLNGVPAEKIMVSPHGLPQKAPSLRANDEPLALSSEPLRAAFLGRLDRTKGVDVLVRAMRLASTVRVKLDVYGIAQNPEGTAYLKELKSLAGGDPRISFLPPVPSGEVVNLLRSYHILTAPSQWLETGPLVVLEAFDAGIPVLGSNLGGIAELVRHGVDGLLIEPSSALAWSEALRQCDEDRSLLIKMRQNVRPPRRMELVAQEMLNLYQRVLDRRSNQTKYH